MRPHRLSRLGVVRAVGNEFSAIEVSAACGGCSQTGCLGRRSSTTVRVRSTALNPGDQVRLSVQAGRLNAASLAAFGPPVGWALLAALGLNVFPAMLAAAAPFGPVLFGCGMVGALALGGWLGRKSAAGLAIEQERVQPDAVRLAPTLG